MLLIGQSRSGVAVSTECGVIFRQQLPGPGSPRGSVCGDIAIQWPGSVLFACPDSYKTQVALGVARVEVGAWLGTRWPLEASDVRASISGPARLQTSSENLMVTQSLIIVAWCSEATARPRCRVRARLSLAFCPPTNLSISPRWRRVRRRGRGGLIRGSNVDASSRQPGQAADVDLMNGSGSR